MNDQDKIIDEIISDPVLKEQLKKLVIERVNVMPDTLRIAVGSEDMDKESLISHVCEEDDVGKQIMEMELDFLRGLASGAVYASE